MRRNGWPTWAGIRKLTRVLAQISVPEGSPGAGRPFYDHFNFGVRDYPVITSAGLTAAIDR